MALKLTPETELYKQLRAGDYKPCYLFYGKDVATIESVVRRLADKLVPRDARDLNYHLFNGAELDFMHLCDVLDSLPMFAERVAALVNDFNAESAKADDLKLLQTVIAAIDPSATTVVFYVTGIDLCSGKKNLSAKNLKFAESIVKNGGEVVEFAYKRPQELIKYIQTRVQKSGSQISYGAALSLAESCLCSVLAINNEIEKLTAYRFGGEISEADVSELVAGQLDTDAYKLARAVTSGDKNACFLILSELYSRQQESIPLLSVIGGAFLDLYRAKLAMIGGRGEADVASDYGYRGREFVIRNAMRDSSRIPIERLRYCLRVLSDCDIDMKSKKTDSRILLETAITRMLSGEK